MAVTCQLPGAMPEIRFVTATGPLPGKTPATVSSTSKRSCGPGFPFTPIRLPTNRSVTGYGSPSAFGSNQYVTPRA